MRFLHKTLAVLTALIIPFAALATSEEAPLTIDGSTHVTIDEAAVLFDEGAAFLDVRPVSAFDAGRVPGAINLSVADALTEAALAEYVATGDPVVVYCNGIRCGLSAQAIPMLVSWGYTEIYYMREGFPGWEAAGMPVE